MKTITKPFLGILLALSMLLCLGMPSFASDKAKRYQKYVCLGDSISAGYSDITHGYMGINPQGVERGFHTIVGRQAAESCLVYALAGSTTDDIRYLLEEDYSIENTRYARLFVTDAIRADVLAAVKEADLITVNGGSNDLLVAPLHKFMDYLGAGDIFGAIRAGTIREDLQNGNLNDALCGILKTLADRNKLFSLLPTLASYIRSGIQSYYTNWPHIISDIQSLNQNQADLLVLGVYNPLASYDDMESDDRVTSALAYLCDILTPLVDAINLNLRLGAKQYGYTYVSLLGVDVDSVHPSDAGHRDIAGRILAALPDAPSSAPVRHPIIKKLSKLFSF